MTNVEIPKFSDLFVDHLKPESEILSIHLEKLPPAGVGSVMVKAEVTIRNKNDTKEKLYVVAKLIPVDDKAKIRFKPVFKNEVAFYRTIVPTLQSFQIQHGISETLDCFAKFYAARFSLDADEVDDNAVIVLENLAVTGFQNITRQTGFDLEGAKLVLKDLAKFQGTVIALKLQQPETFNEKVMSTYGNSHFKSLIPMMDKLKETILQQNPACADLVNKMADYPLTPPEPREPYASIAHGDLWVNNTMQKFENGKMIANKLVDFQLYSYRSCASDVFFFLWTSCQMKVLQNHLDYLVTYYHDNLVDTLKELQCDTSEFSLDKFLEELRLESRYEFGHALLFAMLVKCEIPISEIAFSAIDEVFSNISPTVYDFFYFMFEECDKRGWLPLRA